MNIRPSPKVVAARHAEIAQRYARKARTSRKRARIPFHAVRLAQLERLYRSRFRGRFPDSPDGRAALHVMAEQYSLTNAPDMVACWIRSRAPWMVPGEALALAGAAAEIARRLSADEMAWRCGLTYAERAMLGITTIGSVDVSAEQRKAKRREAARAKKAEQRRGDGATPRSKSAARTKPWLALGMSRATWFRRGKPAHNPSETNSGAAVSKRSYCCAEIVSRLPPEDGSDLSMQREGPCQGSEASASALIFADCSHEQCDDGAMRSPFGRRLRPSALGASALPLVQTEIGERADKEVFVGTEIAERRSWAG